LSKSKRLVEFFAGVVLQSNLNAGLKVKRMGFVRLTPSAHMQVITQFVNFDIDFDDLGFGPPFDANFIIIIDYGQFFTIKLLDTCVSVRA
jgi:hypothetical protein